MAGFGQTPLSTSSILSCLSRAVAAFCSVSRVTDGLSGSSNRSSEARLVFMRRAIFGLVEVFRGYGLADLPGKDPLDRDGLSLGERAIRFQQVVQGGTKVGVGRVRHDAASQSRLHLRARSRSDVGVFCVFLMNPCNRIMCPSPMQNKTRAILLPRVVRTS